ncbi:MAG: hypothetical protein JNK87_02080 [Bryobacterales bacterium]|nr:hypothetical protein [Bryobacterales bacterium]
MTTHPLEDDLVLHYYGEAADPAVQAHLDACEACRTQFRNLQRVLNVVDGYAVPERAADYGTQVARRLVLPERGRSGRWRLFGWLAPRQFAWAALLVLSLGGAFYAGRLSTMGRPAAVEMAEGESAPDGRILLSAVGNHLDRTQMVLLELSNVAEDGSIQASQEDVVDLLNANRLYRTTASQAGEAAVADTLDELERLLMEVAHLAPRLSARQAEDLRLRILDKGIIWKLRVVGSEVKERAGDGTSL